MSGDSKNPGNARLKKPTGEDGPASSGSRNSEPPDWFLQRKTPPHLRRFPFSPEQEQFTPAPAESADLNAHFDDVPPDDEDWDNEEDFSDVPLTDYVPEHSFQEPRFEPPSFVGAQAPGYSPRRFVIYLLCFAWWIGPMILVIYGLIKAFARTGTLTAEEIAAGFSLLVGFYILATLVFGPVVALLWLGGWAFERPNQR